MGNEHHIESVTQDWLGSKPYFYNTTTGSHGTSFWDAADDSTTELDDAGVADYMRFGYSVFGQTPLRNVRFLRSGETLSLRNGKAHSVGGPLSDHVAEWDGRCTKASDAMECFVEWGSNLESDVVLPLSGGLDSRLLLYLCDQYNVTPECFTYGTSRREVDSVECEIAAQIAGQMNAPWRQISLRGFHRYIPQWYEHWGASVHLHGMYQMAFYNQIRSQTDAKHLLSGIIGDLWAGSIREVESHVSREPRDLKIFGLSRGLSVNESFFQPDLKVSNLEEEFDRVRQLLESPLQRLVYTIRTKMLLLSYLLDVPRMFGFVPESPFLDFEVAMRFATVADESRRDRIWQRDILNQRFSLASLKGTATGFIDLGELERNPLPPLDVRRLARFVRCDYLESVNRLVAKVPAVDRFWLRLVERRRVLPSIGRLISHHDVAGAYNAYLVLRPIDLLLARSEGASIGAGGRR